MASTVVSRGTRRVVNFAQGTIPESPPPPASETLRIAIPAVSVLPQAEGMYLGLYHTAHGCYVPIILSGGNLAVYVTVDGIGVDPTAREGTLAGYTAVEVPLVGAQHSEDAVATALQAAIAPFVDSATDEGGSVLIEDATLDADASVTAFGTQPGISVPMDSGKGEFGFRQVPPDTTPAANAPSQRAMVMDPSEMPRRGTIVGFFAFIDAHPVGEEVNVGISITSGNTPDSSGLPTDVGTSSGTDVGGVPYWLPTGSTVQYDLAAGERLVLSYKTDAGLTLRFIGSGSGADGILAASDLLTDGGNRGPAVGEAGIYELSGGPVGSAPPFQAWGTAINPTNFFSGVGLIIQSDVDGEGPGTSVIGYYSNFDFRTVIGSTEFGDQISVDTAFWPGTANAGVRVAWPLAFPDILALGIESHGIGYGIHGNASPQDDFRIELGEGGVSNLDWTGAVTVDSRQTVGGGDNEWANTSLPALVFPTPGSRFWLLVHRDLSSGTSQIRFSNTTGQSNRFPYMFGQPGTVDGDNDVERVLELSATTPMPSPWDPLGAFVFPGNVSAFYLVARLRPRTILEANP